MRVIKINDDEKTSKEKTNRKAKGVWEHTGIPGVETRMYTASFIWDPDGKPALPSRLTLENHRDLLTVNFGGPMSKDKNIFTAKAIKVPDYKYTIRERESLGNGWYGQGFEERTVTEDNLYVIIKDGECIGQMNPYDYRSNIKSELRPCNEQALKFIQSLGINNHAKAH